MIVQNLSSLFIEHIAAQTTWVREALEAQEFDGLLIAAGEILNPFRDDVDFPFVVNPYFKAWLPLRERPGCFIWLAADAAKPTLLYYQPEDIWHHISAINDAAIEQAFEIEVFSHRAQLRKCLPRQARLAFIGVVDDCPDVMADMNPPSLLAAMDYQRAYKSEYELACLRLANEKAVPGHLAARDCFFDGGSEYDIHMAYLVASKQLDEQLPYGNIIALNERAAVLHYTQKLQQPPVQSRSLLIDAGADVGGYASDISRTYAQAGSVFADLVRAMDELQRDVVDHIVPGMSYVDLHCWTHVKMARLLKRFGLIKGSEDAAMAQGVTRLFFPHGLGHLLGLQVHDRGGWMQADDGSEQRPPSEHPYLRLTRQIEVGQVFTIEPGLYFIDALLNPARQESVGELIDWDMVDRLKPFGGIRIEDNIHVGQEAVRNLTREAWANYSPV